MRLALIATAVLLLVATGTTDATAANPRQDIQIINNNYIINSNQNAGHSARRGNGYGYGYGYDYGPHRGSGYRSRGLETHSEAVRRIQAAHSRYRQNYHPRSYYNSPPSYYDRRGW